MPFPIAALTGAFLADLQFLRTADPFWARGALWLVGTGLASGSLPSEFFAALTGSDGLKVMSASSSETWIVAASVSIDLDTGDIECP